MKHKFKKMLYQNGVKKTVWRCEYCKRTTAVRNGECPGVPATYARPKHIGSNGYKDNLFTP
jgi:hypothetical protein